MFAATLTPEARVAGAAALLADVRRERRDKPRRLPEALQPADAAEAEAIQLATYATLGWSIAGWKVGRAGRHRFAAPLANAALAPNGITPIHLPAGAGMEFEAAFRLRQDLDKAALEALAYAVVPDLADLVMLYEFVESRFAEGGTPGDLEKIADCMANGSAVFGEATGEWRWADVETLGMRLLVDGIEVARHAGSHRAMPLSQLVEAWRDRCLSIGHTPRAGEVVTLGSLTGLLPAPAAGGLLRGEFEGRGALECRLAPPGSQLEQYPV